VALRYVILQFGEDVLMNNISNNPASYSGKRNNLNFKEKTKQNYKNCLHIYIHLLPRNITNIL
jgi:hypothetical protein